MKNKTANYEAIIVMEPSVNIENQKAFFKKLRDVIKEFKGQIFHINTWGLRKLANKNSHKSTQGLYFHFSFEASVGGIEECIRQIKMDENIIYFHFEKLSSKKSPQEHLSHFQELVEEEVKKEKDRQARLQKRKAFFASKSPRTGV